MNTRIIQVSYLAFTLVYFLMAFLLFESSVKPGQSAFASIFSSIADSIFWVGAGFYFLLSIFLSSIGGMMYFFKRNTSTFKIFRNIGISCVVIFLVVVIASSF